MKEGRFRRPPSSTALKLKRNKGEIVEVHGGRILRSTGRKDSHSKVCTAKGPKDRRLRLSAGTAIQFYDVQDRLGYDRPSEAIDWLMKEAKSSIDGLQKLPSSAVHIPSPADQSFLTPSSPMEFQEGQNTMFFPELSFEASPSNWSNSSLGKDQLFYQGGTLQSSFNLPPFSGLNYDHVPESGAGNLFGGDGFSGF
ncbi:transcription factor TCP4-like [Diospyros lotus]|uniref:transcription factor TCP4-like n=1 Tax=Diospyros lotus TaxID=55363 RepID=UPI00225191A2|nr:transcription factor TCP4-like [Diospyros lotus]XP_052180738.1 transcription factor TCP4-like [Diospyros lotus]